MKTSKKNKKIKWIVGTISVLALSFACYSHYKYMHSYENGIQTVFGNEFEYKELTFDVKDGFEYHATNGTHLSIPKNAFVDKTGKSVKGEVTIKFKEFHKAKDILLSGIPMQMNDDRNKYMQSGGMFDIRAFSSNDEIELQKGKSIGVNLAALNDVDDSFNLYYLKNDEEWIEKGKFSNDSNQVKLNALAAISSPIDLPEDPKPDSSDFIFSLSIDLKNSPHLKSFKDVDWVMIRENNEPIPYDQLRKGWDKIKVRKKDNEKNIFEISFSKKYWLSDPRREKKERFKLTAVPALKGKQLAKAIKSYDKNLKKYEKLLAKKEQEEARLELESDLVNTFSIQSMGIWNCDKLVNTEIFAKGTYEFDFENEFLPMVNKVKLYVVLNDQNGVLTFNNSDWGDVPFFPEENVELFAILPDLKVAYISSQEYQNKVNKETVSKFFTNKIKFNSVNIPREKAFSYIQTLGNETSPQLATNN